MKEKREGRTYPLRPLPWAPLLPVMTFLMLASLAGPVTSAANGRSADLFAGIVEDAKLDIAGKAGCGAACKSSGPIIIDGEKNLAIRDVRIDGAGGDCLSIGGDAQNITLENIELEDCSGNGVSISDADDVTIRNIIVRGARGNAVNVENATRVKVTGSYFEHVATGVYALTSEGVVVRNNLMRNMQGPMPRGQGVQFDKVTGAHNAVQCNVIVNEPGRSKPEDAVNMFQSRGTAKSPIQIAGNRVLGGGPSKSGGGILVGDYGGAHILVFQNRLVDPGQYGVAIAGGSHMQLVGNKVYARSQPFTNVGLYVWKVDKERERCHSHRVMTNEIDYTNAKGNKNPAWNGENCGPVEGLETLNRWDALLGASILRERLPICASP